MEERPRVPHPWPARTCVRDPGFSLIELLLVLLVVGLLLGLTVPGYISYRRSQQLRGSTQSLASLTRLSQQRAMATGVDQNLHFLENTYGADFYVQVGATVSYRWSFPLGVHYAPGSITGTTMYKDGTASPSGLVILQNDDGDTDTLSVLSSGIVLIR